MHNVAQFVGLLLMELFNQSIKYPLRHIPRQVEKQK